MKLSFFGVFLLVFLGLVPVKKKRILFLGDSITQMGVNEGGYIQLLQKKISAQRHSEPVELIGAGIGGNKIYDLFLRMEHDVMDRHPSIVLIYIGINDVWHKTAGIGTDIAKYEEFYCAIIKKLQKKKIQVILCTPTLIGEKKNKANPQDTDLDKYSDVVRRLAISFKCKLVDLRKIFLQFEEEHNFKDEEKDLLTTDRVHLTSLGNELVATAMYQTLFIDK